MLNNTQKEIVKLIEKTAQSRNRVEVFSDAVHLMAQALHKQILIDPVKAQAVEDDWQRVRSRYTDEEYQNICKIFALIVEGLEEDRREILGQILEEIGASNTRNGQFLTPSSVAHLMAKFNPVDDDYQKGNVIKICDPACGASVLLIAQAEEMMRQGVSQGDIYIEAGDIDCRACDMSYIELSLLGYAAKVEHKDALAMKEYSEPRYTIGYFMHGMPMRSLNGSRRTEKPVEAASSQNMVKCTPEEQKPVEREENGVVAQVEFAFI